MGGEGLQLLETEVAPMDSAYAAWRKDLQHHKHPLCLLHATCTVCSCGLRGLKANLNAILRLRHLKCVSPVVTVCPAVTELP